VNWAAAPKQQRFSPLRDILNSFCRPGGLELLEELDHRIHIEIFKLTLTPYSASVFVRPEFPSSPPEWHNKQW